MCLLLPVALVSADLPSAQRPSCACCLMRLCLQACPQRMGPHVPAAACCACACRPALNAWDLVYLLSVPVFVADMGMQFFVAFTDHATGDLVTEIPKIRLHYIK